MANIVIQFSPEVARKLDPDNPLLSLPETLSAKTKDLGVVLQAVHPRSSDPRLMTYFTTEVEDNARARQVIERLTDCPGVEAVYLKPIDALP
jgi:hypothetical protein